VNGATAYFDRRVWLCTGETQHMKNQYVINSTYQPVIFASVWAACLLVPLVMLYGNGIVWFGQAVTWLESQLFGKDLNGILGFGAGTALLLGIRIASRNTKNDFIAGPIEMINSYTFFFYGMIIGGFDRAVLYTILYAVLEVFGIPKIKLLTEVLGITEVQPISPNEARIAERMGIPYRQFVLYQYVFSPLAFICSMLSVHWLFGDLIPTSAIGNSMDLAGQFRSLTVFLGLWEAAELLMTCIYQRWRPRLGGLEAFFTVTLLMSVFWLRQDKLFPWVLYGGVVILGWVMMVYSIVENIRTHTQ
jgi:hypothetical protein